MSEKNPAITIAVPSYNHGRYIGRTIGSLFEQTYRNFEIIVIDDGSTDNSVEVIQKTLDENRELAVTFETQENKGLSVTLNRALTMARGRYFGFLPSDDFFHPRKLERQMELLDNHPSLAGCFTWQEVVDAQGNPTTDRAIMEWFDLNYVTAFNYFPLLLERNFLAAPSALMRSDLIIDAGGFDESLVYLQDHDLWLRLLAEHEAPIIHERLLYYRWHGENLTTTETPRSREEKRYLLSKFARSLRPETKRVVENRASMRSHLAASGVDDVDELLAEFDRRAESAPIVENVALREQLRRTEERANAQERELHRLTAEAGETEARRDELERERARLQGENAALQEQVAHEVQSRVDATRLITAVHTLRGSRSYKLLRLAQIFRHGVVTLDPERRRWFMDWLRARSAGEFPEFPHAPTRWRSSNG